MVLVLNLVVLSIGAGGLIVGALTLSNPLLRKWVVAVSAVFLVVGIILTIAANIRTARETRETKGQLQRIEDGQKELIASLEKLSRAPDVIDKMQQLADTWGKASALTPPRKSATPKPPQPPVGRPRHVDAENLGKALLSYAPGTATIINDGTVEAGSFAKQLEIGLRMGKWIVGGDNIKVGDPQFFPDALTIEISSIPASESDHSKDLAKNLKTVLERTGIDSTIRYADLKFPPNFMRIKVAGM